MKTFLSRWSLLGAVLLLPACAATAATPAQDPQPQTVVRLSPEELDNLVAPVALYPDALLAQILVAATFPDEVKVAQQYVRDRGTRGLDEQDWDMSVRSIAHYAPVLNMLANQQDWSLALGQAYAAQPNDVMDAVQRMRAMAREQGNLVSTQEQNVKVVRERIYIEPANPEVIYVPTYEPYYVYSTPIWGYGFHSRYFSFGIGFPIGHWLVHDCDWYAGRVYYAGWYGGGWRHYSPYYRYSSFYAYPHHWIRPNVNVYVHNVNYYNLDRDYRYVRKNVSYARHDRGRRGADRGGYDDARGPYAGPAGNGDDSRGPGNRGNGNGRNDNNGRVASFDEFTKGGTQPQAREAELSRPSVEKVAKPGAPEPRSGSVDGPTVFRGSQPGKVEKPRDAAGQPDDARFDGPAIYRGSQPVKVEKPASEPRNDGPTVFRGGGQSGTTTGFSSTPKSIEGKSGTDGPTIFRGARVNAPAFPAPGKGSEVKTRSTGGTVYRGSQSTQSFGGTSKATAGKTQSQFRAGGYTAAPRSTGGQAARQPMRVSSGGGVKAAPSGAKAGFGGTSVRSGGGSPGAARSSGSVKGGSSGGTSGSRGVSGVKGSGRSK